MMTKCLIDRLRYIPSECGDLLNQTEAAELMNLSRNSFRKYVNVKPVVRTGNMVLYSKFDLNRWIEDVKEGYIK